MSERIEDIVVVGGGLAAAKAAEVVREQGYAGRLTLVTEEPHRPYERPPLSKGVLLGEKEPGTAFVHDEGFYDGHDIELVTGDRVTELDRAAGQVTTASGATFGFDRLLIATGASPRALPGVDEDLEGVVMLRTLDDSTRLHQQLAEVDHVTIVGAGWIGCEVAAVARTLGTDVTLVDPLEQPLERVLGSEVGAIFADLHRDHGVDLRLGVGVEGVAGGGRAEQVSLADGSVVDTDLVVVGIGVAPRTELAEQAGLKVEDGIVVDASLATPDPRILAAGDVASAWHPRYERHLRVEHWANALNQGKTAGRNLLGAGETYDRLPYFYTDQYDLGTEYAGHAEEWDDVVLRGDREARELIAFWCSEGLVVAAMHLNVWDTIEDLKAIIESGRTIDRDRLADPDVPLSELAGS